jgi:hypothetical protein
LKRDRTIPNNKPDIICDNAKGTCLSITTEISGNGNIIIIIIIILLLLLLLTAIGLTPGGSGCFTCVQNMTFVTTNLSLEGYMRSR